MKFKVVPLNELLAQPQVIYKTGDQLTPDEIESINQLCYELTQAEAKRWIDMGLPYTLLPYDEYVKDNTWTKDNNIVLLTRGRTILGMLCWTHYGESNEECALSGFCIKSEHRNKGYGKLLMQHVLDHVRKKFPAAPIAINVMANNDIAIKMYKELGFDITSHVTLFKK